jgi:putative endonuclease
MPNAGAAVSGIALERRLLRGIDALVARLGRGRRTAPHLATGLRGEEEALFHLRKRGFVIVARRWSSPKMPGDVDLIGWDGETLCFIEVKTRTGRDIVPAEFAVDRKKQETLRGLASIYATRLPESKRRETPMRFDVVSVYFTESEAEVEVFRGAFKRRGPSR